MAPTGPLAPAFPAQEADRLGIAPLGPVPADLPDAWLLGLEAQAGRLAGAAEAAEYEMLQGRDGVPSSVYRAIARRHLLTDELEAACAARLPHEEGLRRRWLEVIHAECRALRLAADPELEALTDEIERAVWRFQPAPAAAGADPRTVARQRMLAGLPLAETLREPVRRQVRRRNALARAEGYPDFYALRCDLQAMPVGWHGPLFDDLEAAVAPAMERLVAWVAAQEGEPVREIWQLRGAMRVHAAIPKERYPDVSRAALARLDEALGLPDVGDVITLEVGPFASGGLCNVIDPAADVRLVVADWLVGSGPQLVMMHEYGHARHAIGMARSGLPHHLATMMKGAPAAICEALAFLFEGITEEPAWIAEATGAAPAELEALTHHARLRRTVATATELFEAAFERALYADPEADLVAVRRALGRRLLGLELEEEALLWPCDPVRGFLPAHHAAYVLAAVAAEQLRAARGGGVWGDRAVGGWLEEHFYRPAGGRSWHAGIEAATGAPLAAAALARRIAP